LKQAIVAREDALSRKSARPYSSAAERREAFIEPSMVT
jgi:hypothetical protein